MTSITPIVIILSVIVGLLSTIIYILNRIFDKLCEIENEEDKE